MEAKNTSKITSLLQKITAYQEDYGQYTSSPSSKSDKPEENVKKKEKPIDEKYFFVKLRYLLGMPKKLSFCNVEIEPKKFVRDIIKKIDEEVSKNRKLSKQKANEIKEQIKYTFYGEDKIELDSFFLNVPGKNILKFLTNTEDCSFPSIDINIINDEMYTVIVESTHSLNSTLVKKAEQLRKYYLFFSSLDNYICEYKEYLNDFYDGFIKDALKLQKESPDSIKTNYQLSKNFLVLIVTDNKVDIFRNTMSKIENSKTPETLKNSVKKCFPSIFGKEFKNEINEINEINEKDKSRKKDYTKAFSESLENIKYLISQINKEKNWIVKVIYFDLYLDLIVPKDDIAKELKGIKEQFNQFNEEISALKLHDEMRENKMNVWTSVLMKKLDSETLSEIKEKLEIEEKKFMELKEKQKHDRENEMKKEEDSKTLEMKGEIGERIIKKEEKEEKEKENMKEMNIFGEKEEKLQKDQ